MKRPKNTPTWREVVKAAARAAYVDRRASEQEERGRSFGGGVDLMDVAPKSTPSKATKWARELVHAFEDANHATIEKIVADCGARPSDFGHYLAMNALGHGVGLSDLMYDLGVDRKFSVPYREYY